MNLEDREDVVKIRKRLNNLNRRAKSARVFEVFLMHAMWDQTQRYFKAFSPASGDCKKFEREEPECLVGTYDDTTEEQWIIEDMDCILKEGLNGG